LPACRRMAATRTTLSRIRRISRNVYMPRGSGGVAGKS
jgi:hypothetical protein